MFRGGEQLSSKRDSLDYETGITKRAGSYRKGDSSPWAGEAQDRGGVCQIEGPCNRLSVSITA